MLSIGPIDPIKPLHRPEFDDISQLSMSIERDCRGRKLDETLRHYMRSRVLECFEHHINTPDGVLLDGKYVHSLDDLSITIDFPDPPTVGPVQLVIRHKGAIEDMLDAISYALGASPEMVAAGRKITEKEGGE